VTLFPQINSPQQDFDIATRGLVTYNADNSVYLANGNCIVD